LCALLQIDHIKRSDNFFDIGANSVLVVQIAATIRRDLSVKFSVSDIFDAPTIAELAELLDQPRGEIEQGLAGILCALLQIDHIKRSDNFFDIGANSLLVVQIAATIRRDLNVKLSVSDIFDAPTIAELAEVLDRARETTAMRQHER
jgi:acyl carrier protein